ncbi:thyroid peroxidase [Anolis sagrei]|uniref:thyroid peroxidase n=1 Tax=Anolis sagrei TaxID=38937 RepID=UPI0035209DB3
MTYDGQEGELVPVINDRTAEGNLSKKKKMKVFIFFMISITMATMAVFLAFVPEGRNELFGETKENEVKRTAQETEEETNKGKESLLQRQETKAPSYFLAFPKYLEEETRAISQAAEKMEASIQDLKEKLHSKYKRSLPPNGLLSTDVLMMLSNVSGCLHYMLPPKCVENCMTSKYRHITGACNNRDHPRWGASNTALARWLPPVYEDGLSQPKGWNPGFLHNGFPLPPVREVTRTIIEVSNEAVTEDEQYSDMITVWGQYIDHDLAFTPQSINRPPILGEADCSMTCENRNPCFPIQVFANDTLSVMDCLPFYRSSPACTTGLQGILIGNLSILNPRQQINGLTSFIDASTVYGSTTTAENKLRNLTGNEGLLRINVKYFDNGREYLPFVNQVPSACVQDPKTDNGERIECFMAGDTRSSEVISLTAVHTLWLREHNRLAKELKKRNMHWSPEIIYQEARKIVGALHQIITMKEYVPKIIGPEAFNQYIGPYKGYDSNIDPTVSNVFSTAAFRFAHAAIHPTIKRLNAHYQHDPSLPNLNLHEVFFTPWRLINEGGLDPILRGTLATAAKLPLQDQLMNEELTKKLFVLSNNGSLDLASLDLQRGRDHGLPGFNDWRNFCDLPMLKTENDLTEAIQNKKVVQNILELYGSPDNIDVWLGGILENFLPDARTGPLFACIIGKQMKALRDGDRFWWENDDVFTEAQRCELRKYSLSRLICDNTGITEIPHDVFKPGKYPKDFEPCENIPSINLEAWQETPQAELPCGFPKGIEDGGFVYCSKAEKPIVTYSCDQGYMLLGEEQLFCTKETWNSKPPICQDINECENKDNPPCHSSAKCVNLKGTFQCLCTDPYELAEDRKSCTDYGKLSKGSLVSIILGAILVSFLALLSWLVVCWW